jgi:hypothetical protein
LSLAIEPNAHTVGQINGYACPHAGNTEAKNIFYNFSLEKLTIIKTFS